MRDYGISVLEQYELQVDSTRRIRGAVLCDTDKGLFLLKEVPRTVSRLPVLAALYRHLEENGFPMVDSPLANREGEYLTVAEDGTAYMVKRWFQGKECDIRRESELKQAVRHLAGLHEVMKLEDNSLPVGEGLDREFERHSRELRKVRNYARKRSAKREFEYAFLQAFDEMYRWAQRAEECLEKSEYKILREEAVRQGAAVHGEYNYHNILICDQGIAVTGFEHACCDLQLADFYYFLRKTLEKNHFDEKMGYQMLRAYDSVCHLDKRQREYLAIRLAYPEKFWKLANAYYCSNKAWLPERSAEKLRICVAQNEEKRRFLAGLFSFRL